MSHSAPTPSAPGTPLAEQTVGEIVAANPNLSRVFQAHDIGFCCQGKLTLQKLTNGYQPPADACNTYRALFAGLADFEADTARHIHLENDVLFPRALERLAV